MAKCKRCGSTKVTFHREYAGSTYRSTHRRTGVKHSLFAPSGIRCGKRSSRYVTVGLCKNCGYSWTLNKSGFCSDIIDTALGLLIITIVIGAFIGPERNVSSNNNVTSQTISESTPSSIWSSIDTPLSDFSYYIENEEIHLEKYKGTSTSVKIASFYEVEGTKMPVVSLEGTFTLKHIDSAIIPEGVTYIVPHSFNSCGIKYVYLPSTLNNFSGCLYFHKMIKLYYGGSEEQWDSSFSTPASTIDTQEIIFNANLQDLN